MDLGNGDGRSVHHESLQLQRVPTDDLPPPPALVHLAHYASLTSSTSEALTVIPWPGRQTTSQHDSPPSSSQSFSTIRPNTERNSIGINEAAYASNTPLIVRSDEEQIRSDEGTAVNTREGMENDIESGSPTPVDDTPYIRFAIDQLTIKDDLEKARRPLDVTSIRSSDSYPVHRIIPDLGLGYLSTQQQREELALIRKHRSTPTPEASLFNSNATRPLSQSPCPSLIPRRQNLSAGPKHYIPVDAPTHTPRFPPLTYTPRILRPTSLSFLSLLCLLMIAAIIFCAIHSTNHQGLYEWSGGVHGGRYFLFEFLPQILAACIFIYVQAVFSASTRIMPYTLMAMDDAYARSNALFLGLFPRTMLCPQWSGPLFIKVANLLQWLTIFTIPLQSCLFSVTPIGPERFRWATVQVVAWMLVAMYILVLIGTAIRAIFFFRRKTGLIWDARSIADIISLLPRSNCLEDYVGTDVLASKRDLQVRLTLRSDRLGYWMTQHRTQGFFHCVGEEGTSTRRYTMESGKISEKKSGRNAEAIVDIEGHVDAYSATTRYRHISWYLRDTFVVLWAVAGFLVTLAIIIVSFLPSTSIIDGFLPLLPVVAPSNGWSSGNFLYSFVPSLLGMCLYLLIQSPDMSLRKLQPWAELGKLGGSTAGTSLLVDYTAALPVECTWQAIITGHYRVALVSLISFLSILLPVLGGGVFFALTTSSGEVRMFPNQPAFYIIIILLVLYVIALVALIPKRNLMHLPHDVGCLAEIFSFVHASRMLDDAAFRAPRSKEDLVTRLMITQDDGQHALYGFGLYSGRNGKECLGIDKLGRPGPARLSIIER